MSIAVKDIPDGKIATSFWKLKHFHQYVVDRVRSRIEQEYPLRFFDMFEHPYSAKFLSLNYADTRMVDGKYQNTFVRNNDLQSTAPTVDNSRPTPYFKHFQNGTKECLMQMEFEVSFREPYHRQLRDQCPEKKFLHKALRCVHDQDSGMKTMGVLIEAFEELQNEYDEYRGLPRFDPKLITYRPDAKPLLWETFYEFDNSEYVRERKRHNNEHRRNRQVRLEKEAKEIAKTKLEQQKSTSKPVEAPSKVTSRPPEGPTRAKEATPEVTHPVVENNTANDDAPRTQFTRIRSRARRTAQKQKKTSPEDTAPDAQIQPPKTESPAKKGTDPDLAPPKKKKRKSHATETSGAAPKPQNQGAASVPMRQPDQRNIMTKLEPKHDFEQRMYGHPPPTRPVPIRTFDYGHESHQYVPQTSYTYREVAQFPRGALRGHSKRPRGGSRGYFTNAPQQRYYEVTNSVPYVPGEQ